MSRVLKSAYLSYAAMKRNCLTAATNEFLYNLLGKTSIDTTKLKLCPNAAVVGKRWRMVKFHIRRKGIYRVDCFMSMWRSSARNIPLAWQLMRSYRLR